METLIGLILLAIIAVVAWCVASEGAWGAGITFLCVLFAGLLAMNYFEPVAVMLEGMLPAEARNYTDLLALMGLFILFTFLGRLATDSIAPSDIEYDARVYQAGRWLFALGTGYVTMAFLLTALHTAPLPREFIGFKPERKNLFDVAAPDRQWLGFTQHVSEKILGTGNVFDGTYASYPETDQKIWPSFAMRYATRRDDIASPRPGVSAGGAPAAPPPAAGPGGPANKTAF